jgi:hypothetical protein
MNRRVVRRISIAVLLLGAVLGMGVHYDTEQSTHYPYPDTTDLKISPEGHLNTQVFVFGTVEEINEDQNTARVRIDTDEGPFTAEVTRFSTQRNVQPGGVVQVVGTFQGEYLIEADTVRVVNPAGASYIYKYAVSVVAAGLIMVLFFRYWRVNIRTLSVEER